MKLYSSKSYIHPVAASYFTKVAAAGGSVADKNSINKFVIELSKIVDPSLWVCWPLRSSQNIGTGTTAFSLGSLGDFNGTLVNGPTWGSDEMSFVRSSSQYIQLPSSVNFLTYDTNSIISVARISSGSTALRMGTCGIGNQGIGGQFSSNMNCFSSVYFSLNLNTFFGTTTTNRDFISSSRNGPNVGSSGFCQQNSTIFTRTGNIKLNPSIFTDAFLGRETTSTVTFWDGGISFILYSTAFINQTQMENIRNLFKNTLGQGLGLP